MTRGLLTWMHSHSSFALNHVSLKLLSRSGKALKKASENKRTITIDQFCSVATF